MSTLQEDASPFALEGKGKVAEGDVWQASA